MSSQTKLLDVTGMTCPMPLIEIRTAVDALHPGDCVEVRGDDPIFESTVRDFCSANDHTIVSVETQGHAVVMRIRKC